MGDFAALYAVVVAAAFIQVIELCLLDARVEQPVLWDAGLPVLLKLRAPITRDALIGNDLYDEVRGALEEGGL